MHAFNILVRVVIILFGVAVAFALPPFDDGSFDTTFRIVFGAVVILYGGYRLTSYLSARRKYNEE